MKIPTIRKGFEAFESKFKPFEMDLMQILTIQKSFEASECTFQQFEKDLKHSDANSNHLNGIRSIRM